MFVLSLRQIKMDAEEAEAIRRAQEAELAGQEEAEEDEEDDEDDDGDDKGGEDKPEDKKEEKGTSYNLLYLIWNCDTFQKINFLMILCVFTGQILKTIFDAYAATWVSQIVESDTYLEIDSIWIFNQVCMYLDAINICLGAISLLKYTSIAVPGLNAIILTMMEFSNNTVRKTIFMILLIYVLFGFMSYFILSYY